ncbi:MAG: prevent-host-death family protein [Streptomyces sp.]|uniref:prevent-host-death family protein n=1 Tax=Streptomyces sp. TaxID=1931 RepID=UPI003D6B3630
MSTSHPESVTFSDLSRNPRAVAERAAHAGRLRVTHRDAPDFYLTAAAREERRDDDLSTSSRMFLALMRHDAGARAVLTAMPDVFPWIRHLAEAEVREFTVELIEGLSDAAELGVDGTAQEVISGWRATARIKADPEAYQEARRPTEGDFGRVELSKDTE